MALEMFASAAALRKAEGMDLFLIGEVYHPFARIGSITCPVIPQEVLC
jgi:hypothetical protein